MSKAYFFLTNLRQIRSVQGNQHTDNVINPTTPAHTQGKVLSMITSSNHQLNVMTNRPAGPDAWPYWGT